MLIMMSLITVGRTNAIKYVEMGFFTDSGKEESKSFQNALLCYNMKLNQHLV